MDRFHLCFALDLLRGMKKCPIERLIRCISYACTKKLIVVHCQEDECRTTFLYDCVFRSECVD